MLRYLKQCTILLWLPFASMASDAPKKTVVDLANLKPLKWQHRIILIQEESMSDSPAITTSALSQLKQAEAAINERHVIWFILTTDGVKSNYSGTITPELKTHLNKIYFSNNQNPTTAVLIGKDGYVKKRTKQLELQTFFDLIDSMPMRQSEISDQIGS